jgi:hypothetical protein
MSDNCNEATLHKLNMSRSAFLQNKYEKTKWKKHIHSIVHT